MAARRRFLAGSAAEVREIRLDPPESHRLLRVLRLRRGAEVEVFDGRGHAFAARFLETDADGRCRLERGEALPAREPDLRLRVGVAIPKGDGLTGIIRQLSEIGIAALTPLATEHSEGADSPARLPRWRAAALSGTRQSGRAVIPLVRPPAAFRSWIEEVLPPDRWIAVPGAPGSAAAAPPPTEPPFESVLAIGPEGGFSPAELQAAAARRFSRLDLGERVLRTGTAAVVAAAALLAAAVPPEARRRR